MRRTGVGPHAVRSGVREVQDTCGGPAEAGAGAGSRWSVCLVACRVLLLIVSRGLRTPWCERGVSAINSALVPLEAQGS